MAFPQLYVGFFINILGQLLSLDEFVLVGAMQSHEVLQLLSCERSKGKWGQRQSLCHRWSWSESLESPSRKHCGCDLAAHYLFPLSKDPSLISEVRTCSHLGFPGLT